MYQKKYYLENVDNIKAAARANYESNPDNKLALSRAYYDVNVNRKKAAVKALYYHDPEKKRAAVKSLYLSNPDKKRAAVKGLYCSNPFKKRAAVKGLYCSNPFKKRAAVKGLYCSNPDKKRAAVKRLYHTNPDKKKALSRVYYVKNHDDRLKSFRKYHCCYKNKICNIKKARYHLAPPTPVVTEVKLRKVQSNLLNDVEAKSDLIKVFKMLHGGTVKHVSSGLGKTVCQIAARKLVNKVLQSRKISAGALLATIRSVKSISLKGRKDFGEGCHSAPTEPYFYEAAYQPVQRDSPIPVNRQGQCIVAEKISFFPKSGKWKTWKCTKGCRPISDSEVDAILCLKSAFELSIEELRTALTVCDYGCPCGHYSKLVKSCPVDRIGHPIVCYCGSLCTSQLRILRAASTHFPVLRQLLREVHSAIASHKFVLEIDEALSAGDYHKLMEIANIRTFGALLKNDLDSKYEQYNNSECGDSVLRQPDLEEQLVLTHATLITELDKEINDFPEHVCCCCDRLNQRKSISVVRLSDNFNSDVWPDLKCHILKNNPDAAKQVLYMCYYCKNMIKSNKMPPRCVLNGLQTVPIPLELALLDPLSRQLIQRAKCYQTIVRLSTYTGKVPHYNSLKACKGTMFFLPLPLNKTLETLNDVNGGDTSLPNPELYIIVNGKPTKSKVIRRTLVNVNHVKKAINTLKSCNWLYKQVQKESVDESTKHIIEVSNNAKTKMLEKASSNEIDAFQAYTIRNLDNKLSTSSDIEQYKVLNVTEDPI